VDRLRACELRWGLTIGDRLAGGFRSEVFTCSDPDLVVKLPATATEMGAEAAALTAWAHTGAAVRLVDADFSCDALLLERVRPGIPGGPVPVAAAADLLRRLHGVAASGFVSQAEIYPALEAVALDDIEYERQSRGELDRAEAGLVRLGAARKTAYELCADSPRNVLLHGDFLTKNLLSTSDGFVAIDPIPRLGDPCSDIGFFASDHSPAAILPVAVALARTMGASAIRAQQWAAVWTVLQTVSAWREDQAELDALVATEEFDALLSN
jgi:aminoglycoside/hydroxyurea antibiotic resistance kinase